MRKFLIATFQFLDDYLVRTQLKFGVESNSIIGFLFHGVFENQAEIDLDHVYPQQEFTLTHYRVFIEYFLQKGYTFIAPDDIVSGLDAQKKYLLLTFDDGYFNNVRIIPLLREYQIPATFFISTNQVIFNRNFWWDVLFREHKKRGRGFYEIYREAKILKTLNHEEIENRHKNEFDKKAYQPISDADRPFTPKELKDFSREKYVHLGNHTSDHGILTLYDEKDMRRQIQDAQDSIKEITGRAPLCISYPNGNYSREVLNVTRDLGFKVGISCDFVKSPNAFGQDGDRMLSLGRFCFFNRNDLEKESDRYRSDFSPFVMAKRFGDYLQNHGAGS